MDISNYFQILEQKKSSWLFKKDDTAERLEALTKIAELGYPSLIHNLIPFLKDSNTSVQQKTADTITHLFKKLNAKNGYYDSLKHCVISQKDLDYYQQTFTNENLITLFAIASLNGSGFVREKAVKKLIEINHESVIPFIIFRLADWVPIIRNKALEGIYHYKKKKSIINALVENLDLFEWLKKVKRIDLSDVLSEILHFIFVENRQYIIENLKTFSDKTRTLMAGKLVEASNIHDEDLKLFLSDSHFLVRRVALDYFDRLTQTEIDKLLVDKAASIRVEALRHLKNKVNFLEIVLPFLSDNAASVRDFARHHLKNTVPDFAIIYNDNLKSKKHILGSINGLAEINAKQFSNTIEPFLNDTKIKIRKAAFLALTKMDEQKIYPIAIDSLDSEFIGIRNLAIQFLQKSPSDEALKKARNIYANGNIGLKFSMLKMFNNIGGWTALADIILGTIDENEKVRDVSSEYLKVWENKAVRLFTKPKVNELERTREIFRFAFERHDDKKYFNRNPLVGFDFYLR
ncbi:MAG: hypothetical protein QM726_15240 [Chitinophagaceae bacterium]